MTNKTQWTKQEEKILFSLQQIHGNRWAYIASQLPTKKQVASIKNKFYSTVRKGHRKLNNYIKNIKKKEDLYKNRALKLIQQIFIIKLVSVVDNNYDAKYQVKQTAIKLANNIQHRLIEIALSDNQYDKRQKQIYEVQQKLLKDILEFNKSCKKRKGKKKQQKKSLRQQQSEQNIQEKQLGDIKEQSQYYQSEIIEADINQNINQKNIEKNNKNIVNNHNAIADNNFFNNLKNLSNVKVQSSNASQFGQNLSFFNEVRSLDSSIQPFKLSSFNNSRQFYADNWLIQSTNAAKKKAASFQYINSPAPITPVPFFNMSNFNHYSINGYINQSMKSIYQNPDKNIIGQSLVSSTRLKQQIKDDQDQHIIQGIQISQILKTDTILSHLQSQRNNRKTSISNLNDQYSFLAPNNHNYKQSKIKQKSNQNNKSQGVIQITSGNL